MRVIRNTFGARACEYTLGVLVFLSAFIIDGVHPLNKINAINTTIFMVSHSNRNYLDPMELYLDRVHENEQ